MAFMENNIWKIEKAGLYFFGHVNAYFLRVELSRRGTFWAFSLPVEKVQQFLDILDLDYEDGKYVYELLHGKYITVMGDNGSHIGSVVKRIGDPYGFELMDVGDAM